MTPEQDAALAEAGQMARDAINSIAIDPYLPDELSPMGRSAVTAVVGAIEGLARESLGKWDLLDKKEFQLIAQFGSQVIHALGTNGSAAEQVDMVTKGLLAVGTGLALELAKDAVNVVPIAGAVISAVLDIITMIIAKLEGKSTLELAIEAEQQRFDRCRAVLAGARVQAPSAGASPSDVFNGATTLHMPALGLGLVAATEINGFVRRPDQLRLRKLRRLIQGSWLGEGLRGREFDGSTVPLFIEAENSDGGATLWPLYLDTILWLRSQGRIPDDAIYTGLAAVTECAPEIVPMVVATLDNWAEKSLRAKTGAGYVQFAKTPLTPSQTLVLRVSAAAWAGEQAGRKYVVAGAGDKIALVEADGGALSFPKGKTGAGVPVSTKARSSGGAIVFALVAGAVAFAAFARR